MKKLLDLWYQALEKQQLVVLAVLFGLICFGIWNVQNSEIEAFPDLTNIQVQVITQYPGKAAEEVERLVTIPLEIATTGLPGLINQRSISIFGLSVITLTFDDQVMSRQARLDVSQRLSDADLPDTAKPSLSPDSTPVGEIYRYVLEGEASVLEKRLVEDWVVERSIRSIPGVADVVGFGGPVKTIDVQVEPAKLASFGLTLDLVAQSLGQNHINAGGGILQHGSESYLIRSIGLLKESQLENAVVSTSKNVPIRIRDIGKVQNGNKIRLGQVGYNEDSDAVEGIVLLRQGADTLGTCEKVRQKIEYLNKEVLPDNIKIKSIYDRTHLIERSGHTVLHNIIFGILLVFILLMIGLGWRFWILTLAVALVIPFALLCAFAGVHYYGLKPNLISLGAVDFGIIVETAIFAAEAIIHEIAHNKSELTQKSKMETLYRVLLPALMCAFLLLIAFIPILSLQRVEGRIFKPLGITLVSALIGGQIGAFLFIPFFARWTPKNYISGPVDRILVKLQIHLLTLIDKIKNIRYLSIMSLGILLSACFVMFLNIGREFLPQLNEGSLYIRASAPPTISRRDSQDLANHIRKLLKEIPEVENVVSQLGRPDDGTDVNGFNNVEVLVLLKAPDEWTSAKTIEGLTQIAQKKLSPLTGVEFNFSQPIKDNVDEAISGVKGELVIKIFGQDINQLQSLADQIKDMLQKIPGAEDVGSEELKAQPELRFSMDHNSLARYGLRVSDAESALESAVNGKFAAKMTDDQGRQIDIVVKAQLSEPITKSDLESLSVISAEGLKVPLGEVTKADLVEGVSRIYREEGQRRIAVKCSVRGRAVVDFVKEASSKIKGQIQLPDHYRMQWSGSFENADRASSQLMIIVPICVALMILLLYAWLKNWQMISLILWEVPFSIVGSLIFLYLFRLNLSISAAAGVIVVIGVSFLTGIMYILEAYRLNDYRQAFETKLRSILISSGVAIIGLIPAAFSTGIGSETAKPFAVSILGGLVTALILSLILLPALTSIKQKNKS